MSIQMSVSESDNARVVRLMRQDVEATLGPDYEAVVRDNAVRVASFADEPVWYRDKLVEDVQQDFHDWFVDTTWPACPRHSTHPLWLHGEFWYCERDDVATARFGDLRSALTRGKPGTKDPGIGDEGG